MIKLNEYKDSKAIKETQRETVKIIEKLTNCIESLKEFSKHINVMESISILHNSRTLFEIKLDKLKKEEK